MSGVAPGSARSLAALGQRPPRLTIRVVVYTAILIGIGAATLLVFIRHFERGRAESTARLQASVVTQGVVDRLAPSDLLGPLTPARKAELRQLLETRVLDDETPAAAVATADGRVVYATPGADSSLGSLSPVLRESILSGVVTSALVDARTDGETTRVLRTYSPFRLNDGSTGVVAIDKDYAPIARSARQAAIAVAAILELVLIFLWLCLIPMMRRATKSIHRQLDTIAQLALHDDLTGLANRARLGAHLDELCEPPSGPRAFSVFFIDLDRFKDVNDTLGHDRGDELLVEVARRLSRRGRRGRARRTARRRRVRGRERERDRRRRRALTRRAALGRDRAACSRSPASVWSRRRASASRSPRRTARRATSCSAAPTSPCTPPSGRARRGCTPESSTTTHPCALGWPASSAAPSSGGELVADYQPQFDLAEGRIRGAEALVRWRHPTLGLVEPDQFLAAGRAGGPHATLTRYVLEEALAQLRDWRDAGLDLGVAVNVSERRPRRPGLARRGARILAEHGIEPSSARARGDRGHPRARRVRAVGRLERIVATRRPASRSTTSAPATRRSGTSSRCPSTSSRSTARSSRAWPTDRRRRRDRAVDRRPRRTTSASRSSRRASRRTSTSRGSGPRGATWARDTTSGCRSRRKR